MMDRARAAYLIPRGLTGDEADEAEGLSDGDAGPDLSEGKRRANTVPIASVRLSSKSFPASAPVRAEPSPRTTTETRLERVRAIAVA
jgi:hypothetical protein